MMKAKTLLQKVDPVFVVTAGILLLVGLIILQSASGPSSYAVSKNPYSELIRQLKFGVLPGLAAFFLISQVNYSIYKKLSGLIWIGVIGLNLLIFVPSIKVTANGATRWISIAGFSIQPSEFLKLGLLIYLAALLAQFGAKINRINNLFIISFIIAISTWIVVVPQSNLSTSILLLLISCSMIFQSKIKLRFVAIAIIVIAIIGGAAISSKQYRRDRFMTFFQPDKASKDEIMQSENNLIAVGSGGLTGVGWGQSRQKFGYLPEASTDSIFAIFAEEFGFVGAVLLLFIFFIIIIRIVWISMRVKDDFARYILIGAATWIMFQSLINIATTIRLAPVTGIPLPFVSAGGSSILVLCILFGIIANISKNVH